MFDKPIIMSGESVRAILAGTKTQTRRVVRDFGWWNACGLQRDDSGWPVVENDQGDWIPLLPPYQRGDVLWVREQLRGDGQPGNRRKSIIRYGADGEMVLPCCACGNVICTCVSGPSALMDRIWKWKRSVLPSSRMPRWASRLSLLVTDVRCQRVQDISEEDARAEGSEFFDGRPVNHHGWRHDYGDVYATARDSFAAHWDSINAKRGYPWASNPWVWAITFERVQQRPERSDR